MDDNSTHAHILSLGISNFNIKDDNNSIIGQSKARQGLAIILESIKQKKMAGKAIMLCGRSGIGKTALAVGFSKELGDVPFVSMSATQMKSKEIKKSEVISEALRSSITVKIKEIKQIFEGESINLEVGKTEIKVSLQSQSGVKEIKLPRKMEEDFLTQKIRKNDVIFIEKGTGIIQRLGRSESKRFCDLDTEIYLPIPKTVESAKEVIKTLTLHELDIATSKSSNASKKILSTLYERKSELTDKLRNSVDEIVDNYVSSGLGEIQPGVLFIDEAHFLDSECLTFFNKILETSFALRIIFATNRNLDVFPDDFIDRCLLIQLEEYSDEEAVEIVLRRIHFLKIKVDERCREIIKEVVKEKGIRKVLNIFSFFEGRQISSEEFTELEKLFD